MSLKIIITNAVPALYHIFQRLLNYYYFFVLFFSNMQIANMQQLRLYFVKKEKNNNNERRFSPCSAVCDVCLAWRYILFIYAHNLLLLNVV